jgi:hypothetical protein
LFDHFDHKENTMKRFIPAVFFQNQLNGVKEPRKKPELLELFDNQLSEVVGGLMSTDTYSGSDGWADVANADDCGG